jgi:hypothetical protein
VKDHVIIIAMVSATCLGITLAMWCGCAQPVAKTATNVAVKIADDVCKELGAGDEPEWVVIACQAPDLVGGVVNIAMPRAQWAGVKARRIDAGPGK